MGWLGSGALLLGCSSVGLSGDEPAPAPREAFVGKAGITWVSSASAGIFFAKTETTVEQFRACVDAGACPQDTYDTVAKDPECNLGNAARGGHPMNCVSSHGAKAFCVWADARLPTAGEWRVEASHGGTRKFPWGAAAPTCDRVIMGDGEMQGCGRGGTWPVCSRPRGQSASGLCDMSGNVWEDTLNEDGGFGACGGAWRFDGQDELGAFSCRSGGNPDGRGGPYGFRCVRSTRSLP